MIHTDRAAPTRRRWWLGVVLAVVSLFAALVTGPAAHAEETTSAPGAPTDVTATAVADSVTTTWSAPESLGSDADGKSYKLDHYEVAVATEGTPADGLLWTETTDTTHSATGLEPATYTVHVRAVNSAGQVGEPATATVQVVPRTASGLPLQASGGTWDSGHVQGIAVDQEGGFLYYSFTTMLVKTDFDGRVIGSVTNWGSGAGHDGHLGDLSFNPDDGKVYGSLTFDPVFYAAIFDVDRIDRLDMDAQHSGILKTVHLNEVAADYLTDLDGDGVVPPDGPDNMDHRFAVSGHDGTAFGPKFGETDGPNLLTFTAGKHTQPEREDNNHHVLYQYDISDWNKYAKVFHKSTLHTSGPDGVATKAFVYTGNSNVQNLTYDAHQQRWFLNTYGEGKPDQFPSYYMYAFEADTDPVYGDVVGTGEQGLLIDLADDGLQDPATGIRGWTQQANVGFESLGNGLFYVSTRITDGGLEASRLDLYRWSGDVPEPFTPVTGADLAVEPGFTSAAAVSGSVGEPLEHTLVANGTPAPTYQVSSGQLPAGLTLDGRTGVLSGTPTTAGEFEVEVTATNQVIADATQTLTITIE